MTLHQYLRVRGEEPTPEMLAAAAVVARRNGIVPALRHLVDQDELEAWETASAIFEVERALRLAQALTDPTAVLAELDGGQAHYAAQARATAQALAQRVREGRGAAPF